MPDQPATPGQQLPPEIEQIIQAQVAAAVQGRVSGLQRIISDREQENGRLASQLRELKVASLSPEEADQFQRSELEQENAKLKAKLEVAALIGQFPDEAPYFERLMDAPDTRSQLEVLSDFARKLKPAPAVVETPAPGFVDPNRPASPSLNAPSVQLADGSSMDEARADMLLGATSGRLSEYTNPRNR